MSEYRYTLHRDVPLPLDIDDHGHLVWVMLNPSTADDVFDDNTMVRVKGFTSDAGYGLTVVNLFARRCTRPIHLFAAGWPRHPLYIKHDRTLIPYEIPA